MKVAVIGGGPSGLATLKFLLKAHEFFPIPPIEARLFEAEARIGGTFRYRVYEDAELVSSKYLTAFSDFRLPKDSPDFLPPARYVQYLEDYISNFDLSGFIECNSRIAKVRRGSGNVGHLITILKPNGTAFDWQCDAVAVCSGLNMTPEMPNIKGLDRIAQVMHSSQLKTRKQFGINANVVVLGAGETAMDVAHLAVTSATKSVTLCSRDGFFCAPKIIPVPGPSGRIGPMARPNKPVDTSVASLFDTAYAHPLLQRSGLLWFAYDTWIKKMHWLISGTEEGPDQWVGQMSKQRKNVASIMLVKSDRALPYMSAGKRSQSWANRLRQSILNIPIKDNYGKTIDVTTWPKGVDENGIMWFEENPSQSSSHLTKRAVQPNIVVYATGYATHFPFLDNDYPARSQANIRGIYKDDDVSVGYIGFVRPSIGAIPPLGELQAQLWVLRLLQDQYPKEMLHTRGAPDAVPHYELDYKLHPRGEYNFHAAKGGVDHESYAYQLAVDMEAAPTISHVMRQGWKVFFTWAMGSNFNPKFRMVGPWRVDDVAVGIMEGELYDVVKRSGGFVYLLTYTIIPFMIFGTMSVLLYGIFSIRDLVTAISPISRSTAVPRSSQRSKSRRVPGQGKPFFDIDR